MRREWHDLLGTTYAVTIRSWLFKVSDKAAKSYASVSAILLANQNGAYLCLPRLSIVIRYSDIIEQTMQLPYDSRHLRGEVACVHGRHG